MSNKLTKHEEKPTAITTPSNAALELLEQHSGSGLEKVTREDTSIPFIGVLQDLSPQVKKSEPKYVPGAEVGQLFDFSTNKFFDGQIGLVVIPIFFEKVYNVWKNRKAGGGFLGSFKTRADAEKRADEAADPSKGDKRIPREQIDIVDTGLHFVRYQVPETGRFRTAVLSCKSTALKASRAWILQMQTLEVPSARNPGKFFNPPSWGTLYSLTTKTERKNENTYYNFGTEFIGLVTDNEVLQEAAAAYKALAGGELTVDFTKDENAQEAEAAVSAPVVDNNTKKF